MKSSILFCFLLMLSFCEPGYNIIVWNQSSNAIYLKSSHPIESLYPKQSSYHNIITGKRMSDSSGFSIYSMMAGEKFMIWGNIGLAPQVDELPFSFLQLAGKEDTITLANKNLIIESLVKAENKRDYLLVFDGK